MLAYVGVYTIIWEVTSTWLLHRWQVGAPPPS